MESSGGIQVFTSEVDLPATAIVEYGLTIVAYMTEDGIPGYRFSVSEPVHVSSILGLIEVVKHQILHAGQD